MNTFEDIRNIQSKGSAIPGQIYSARDKNGQIWYWKGTADKRLEPTQAPYKSTQVVNTVVNTTSSTPGSGVQTVTDDGNGVVVVDNTDPLNPEITYVDPGYLTAETDPVWTADKPNYLSSATAASTYQPLDTDLTSWAAIARASGFDTFVTTPSSANLAALITDEVGTGSLVFQSYVDGKKSFLNFSNNTFNPADSTVYYSGGFASVGPSTTAALRRIYFPSACIITDCTLFIVTNVSGSGETVNFAIRLNNTSDTALTSGTISATATTIVTTGLSISVPAGSYIELKTTTPAWVTNPTGTFISGTLSLTM